MTIWGLKVKTSERKMNEIRSRMFLLLCNFFKIGGWSGEKFSTASVNIKKRMKSIEVPRFFMAFI